VRLRRLPWVGDELSEGKEAPREPVVLRQTLQWQIPVLIGIPGSERRVPGAVMAMQRHMRCAKNGEVKVVTKCLA